MNEKDLMDKISFVFQDNKLLKKSLYENIKMGFDVDKKDILDALHKAQCDDIISKFDTGLDTKIGTEGVYLSGGETQRITLARAIVNNPSVLIADEPTGNLDPETAKEIMGLLEDINRAGTTILMATHAKDIVDNMQKRVIAIDKGMVVRDDRKGMYENEN